MRRGIPILVPLVPIDPFMRFSRAGPSDVLGQCRHNLRGSVTAARRSTTDRERLMREPARSGRLG